MFSQSCTVVPGDSKRGGVPTKLMPECEDCEVSGVEPIEVLEISEGSSILYQSWCVDGFICTYVKIIFSIFIGSSQCCMLVVGSLDNWWFRGCRWEVLTADRFLGNIRGSILLRKTLARL